VSARPRFKRPKGKKAPHVLPGTRGYTGRTSQLSTKDGGETAIYKIGGGKKHTEAKGSREDHGGIKTKKKKKKAYPIGKGEKIKSSLCRPGRKWEGRITSREPRLVEPRISSQQGKQRKKRG